MAFAAVAADRLFPWLRADRCAGCLHDSQMAARGAREATPEADRTAQQERVTTHAKLAQTCGVRRIRTADRRSIGGAFRGTAPYRLPGRWRRLDSVSRPHGRREAGRRGNAGD